MGPCLAPVDPNILSWVHSREPWATKPLPHSVHFIEILPVFCPNLLSGFNLSGSICKIRFARCVVAVENGPRLVAADLHGHGFGNAVDGETETRLIDPSIGVLSVIA